MTDEPNVVLIGSAPQGSTVGAHVDVDGDGRLDPGEPALAEQRLLLDEATFELDVPLPVGVTPLVVVARNQSALLGEVPAGSITRLPMITPPGGVPDVAEGTVSLRLRPGVDAEDVATRHLAMIEHVEPTFTGALGGDPRLATWFTARVVEGTEAEAAAVLSGDPGVSVAHVLHEVVPLAQTAGDPDDEYWDLQVPFHAGAELDLPAAWNVFRGRTVNGEPVSRIAVVDSGISRTHPDFDWANDIDDTISFRSHTEEPDDEDGCGHGTSVAGVAGAQPDNGEGVAGVGWHLGIVPVKVASLDREQARAQDPTPCEWLPRRRAHDGRLIRVAFGETFEEAVTADPPPGVINASFATGDDQCERSVRDLRLNHSDQASIWAVSRLGINVVAGVNHAPSGSTRDGMRCVNEFSGFDAVFAAGGSHLDDIAPRHDWGDHLDVVAPAGGRAPCPRDSNPGRDTWAPLPGPDDVSFSGGFPDSGYSQSAVCSSDPYYDAFGGSSAAAPQVSALLALVRDRWGLVGFQAEHRVTTHATDLGRDQCPAGRVAPCPREGWDEVTGWGRMDSVAALTSRVSRLQGVTRYGTAVSIAREAFPMLPLPSDVVIVNGTQGEQGWVDALPATMFAGVKGAPLLLVDSAACGDPDNYFASAEMGRLFTYHAPDMTVHLVGGEQALPRCFADEYGPGRYSVTRHGGADRFETAVTLTEVAISNHDDAVDSTAVLLATGEDGRFADALSLSAVAASRGHPLLLTRRDSLPPSTARFIGTHEQIATVYIAGGDAAVASSVESQVQQARSDSGNPAVQIVRLQGENRYETSARIAQRFFPANQVRRFTLATGEGWPDGVAGGIVSAQFGSPVLLTRPGGIDSALDVYGPADYIQSTLSSMSSTARNQIQGLILGGHAVVEPAVLDEFEDLLPGPPANQQVLPRADAGSPVNTVAQRYANDHDQDGVATTSDTCGAIPNPDQFDLDGDSRGDRCDRDVDGDVVDNPEDLCPRAPNADQADLDSDGIGDACDADADGDDVLDSTDNCLGVSNPTQQDTDADGVGDACDPDIDGDGVDNGPDNCPRHVNPDQSNRDGDTLGDACDPDIDGDQVPNDEDNCREHANPDQRDTDLDSFGDACDADDDNDGFADTEDNCRTEHNPGQEDGDLDGAGDACDDDTPVLDLLIDHALLRPITCTRAADAANLVDGLDATPATFGVDDALEESCVIDLQAVRRVQAIRAHFGTEPASCGGDQALKSAWNSVKVETSIDGETYSGGDFAIRPLHNTSTSTNREVVDWGYGGAARFLRFTPNYTGCSSLGWDDDLALYTISAFGPPERYGYTADTDRDGTRDGIDNCPRVENSSQSDLDRDGHGDACDDDDDDDGVVDDDDNCPTAPNPDQADADGDGDGDACDGDDGDHDGTTDAHDNCPDTWNANQSDFDGDGVGDGCDPDSGSPATLIDQALFRPVQEQGCAPQPERLVDGDDTTLAGTWGWSQTCIVDLEGEREISLVRIHLGDRGYQRPCGDPLAGGYPTSSPIAKRWELASSPDGTTWTQLASGQVGELVWESNPPARDIIVALPPSTSASFLRLYLYASDGYHPCGSLGTYTLSALGRP